jgi:hypothetical protein
MREEALLSFEYRVEFISMRLMVDWMPANIEYNVARKKVATGCEEILCPRNRA